MSNPINSNTQNNVIGNHTIIHASGNHNLNNTPAYVNYPPPNNVLYFPQTQRNALCYASNPMEMHMNMQSINWGQYNSFPPHAVIPNPTVNTVNYSNHIVVRKAYPSIDAEEKHGTVQSVTNETSCSSQQSHSGKTLLTSDVEDSSLNITPTNPTVTKFNNAPQKKIFDMASYKKYHWTKDHPKENKPVEGVNNDTENKNKNNLNEETVLHSNVKDKIEKGNQVVNETSAAKESNKALNIVQSNNITSSKKQIPHHSKMDKNEKERQSHQQNIKHTSRQYSKQSSRDLPDSYRIHQRRSPSLSDSSSSQSQRYRRSRSRDRRSRSRHRRSHSRHRSSSPEYRELDLSHRRSRYPSPLSSNRRSTSPRSSNRRSTSPRSSSNNRRSRSPMSSSNNRRSRSPMSLSNNRRSRSPRSSNTRSRSPRSSSNNRRSRSPRSSSNNRRSRSPKSSSNNRRSRSPKSSSRKRRSRSPKSSSRKRRSPPRQRRSRYGSTLPRKKSARDQRSPPSHTLSSKHTGSLSKEKTSYSASSNSNNKQSGECDITSSTTFISDLSSSEPETDSTIKSTSKSNKNDSDSTIKPNSTNECTSKVLAIETSLAIGQPDESNNEVKPVQQMSDMLQNKINKINLNVNLKKAIVVLKKIKLPLENDKNQIIGTSQDKPLKPIQNVYKENNSSNTEKDKILTENTSEIDISPLPCLNKPDLGSNKSKEIDINIVQGVKVKPSASCNQNKTEASIEKVMEPIVTKEISKEEIPTLESLLKALKKAGKKKTVLGSPTKDVKFRKMYTGLSKISTGKNKLPKKSVKPVFHVNFDIEKPVLSEDENEETKVSLKKDKNQDLNENQLPKQTEKAKEAPSNVSENIPATITAAHSQNLKNIDDKSSFNSNVAVKLKPVNSNPVLSGSVNLKDPRTRRVGRSFSLESSCPPKLPLKSILFNTVSKDKSEDVKPVKNEEPAKVEEVPFEHYQNSPSLDSPLESYSNHNSPIYTSNLTSLCFPPPLLDIPCKKRWHGNIKVNICDDCKLKPAKDDCKLKPAKDDCKLKPAKDDCKLKPAKGDCKLKPAKDDCKLEQAKIDGRYSNSYYYTFLHDKCSCCNKSLFISAVDESLGFTPSTSVAPNNSSILQDSLSIPATTAVHQNLNTISETAAACSIASSHYPLPEISPIKKIVTTSHADSELLPAQSTVCLSTLESLSLLVDKISPTLELSNVVCSTQGSLCINYQPTDAVNHKNESDSVAPCSKDMEHVNEATDISKQPLLDEIEIQENSLIRNCDLKANSEIDSTHISAPSLKEVNMCNVSIEVSDIPNVPEEVRQNSHKENLPIKLLELKENQKDQEMNKNICMNTSNQFQECNTEQVSTDVLVKPYVSDSFHKNASTEEFSDYDTSNNDETLSESNDLDQSGQLMIDESTQLNEDVEQDENIKIIPKSSDEITSKVDEESPKEIVLTEREICSDSREEDVMRESCSEKDESSETANISIAENREKRKLSQNCNDIVGLFDMFVDCDFADSYTIGSNTNKAKLSEEMPTKNKKSLINKISKNSVDSPFHTYKEQSVVQEPLKLSVINRECPIRSLSQEFEQNKTIALISLTSESIADSTTMSKGSTNCTALDSTGTNVLNIADKQDDKSLPDPVLNVFTKMTDQSDNTDLASECMSTASDCILPTIISRPKKRNRFRLEIDSGISNSTSIISRTNIQASSVPFKKRKYSRLSFEEDSATIVPQLPAKIISNAVNIDYKENDLPNSVTSTKRTPETSTLKPDGINIVLDAEKTEINPSKCINSSDALTSNTSETKTKESLFETMSNLFEIMEETQSDTVTPVAEEITNSSLVEAEKLIPGLINSDKVKHDEILNHDPITHEVMSCDVSNKINENQLDLAHGSNLTKTSIPKNNESTKEDSSDNNKVPPSGEELLDPGSSDSDFLNLELEQAERTVASCNDMTTGDSEGSVSFDITPAINNVEAKKSSENSKRSTFSYKGQAVDWPFECIPSSALDNMSDSSDISENGEEDCTITECSVSIEPLELSGYAPLCFFQQKKGRHRCCSCCDTICCATPWIKVDDFAKRIQEENKKTLK